VTVRIAINGFGRIGRTLFRQSLKRKDVEIVAINDLTNPEMLAHLLAYDSVHGRLGQPVRVDGNELVVGRRRIQVTQERDPAKLPWKSLKIDVVAECTGLFLDKQKASAHLAAGARRVILSAPGKDADLTVCIGINHQEFDPKKHQIISNASCTTNCLAPLAKVLHENFGIVNGLMTTVHSYTNDQRILDLPHSDMHRARAAAVNMIPTSTGAAKAIGLVLPALKGKLHGIAVRVPTPNVSLVDLTVQLQKPADATKVNAAFKRAARGALKGVLVYNDSPLVSSDFNGDPASCTFDATQTTVLDGTMVKVLGWYDNETGYSTRLLELLAMVGKAA
jgi:glyceraldehyde 3-phosphate dehydrogenase